jgi:hypothetical protein
MSTADPRTSASVAQGDAGIGDPLPQPHALVPHVRLGAPRPVARARTSDRGDLSVRRSEEDRRESPATKLDVARILGRAFPEFRQHPAPPHPVLGYRPRDKYWLHMIDALAVAVAVERESKRVEK